MFRILVVEDDDELRSLFCDVLCSNGYTPLSAVNGLDALRIMDDTFVDLIISDIMMPDMDGIELTRALRNVNYTTPVLMITAKESSADKREGFRAGVDDYMVKPINVDEMIWRVEALLRRSRIVSSRKAKLGNTEFDCDTLTVCSEGVSVILPQKEFMVLYKLIVSPNRIFTRRQIMDDVWGFDSETDTHTLEVHISRLRERFRNNADFDIVTVRGLGYKAVKKT